PATLNPGVMSGGISINTVPDRAVVEIDVRITPGQNPETLLHWLKDAFTGIDPASYRIHEAFHHSPPMHTDINDAGATGLRAACHSHRPSSEFQTAPYATDAQAFAPFGVPCLVFGPGDIALAHTPGECVNVPELETGVRILKDFLTR
ncbi:MAG: M20/M25/M40 family metallo-hydrolase, partial [Spirochaetia bacterium]|nr:M20/M25/M40 family metallo-hydrolase [Spirochaetia bacterium]